MLEAFNRIPLDIAELTVVGDINNGADIEPYLSHINFAGRISHSEIQNVLHEADAYIFPSLGEGMSLSILEAAACGLPLIISQNSGFSEKITNEGLLIEVQDVGEVLEAIYILCKHRKFVPEIGHAARLMAEKLTWNVYNQRVYEAIKANAEEKSLER